MRITAIEVENFKGISERVRVDLKPITLLFGANSAGKSTILHALLYMKDVLDRRNLDAISTPVSGRALDLGGFRSFVYGQDIRRTIRLALCLDLTGGELPAMAPDYELPSTLSDGALTRVNQIYGECSMILDSITSAKIEIEVRWDEDSRKPVAFAYTVGLSGKDFVRIERGTERVKFAKVDVCNPAVSRPPTDEERERRVLFNSAVDDDDPIPEDLSPAEIDAPVTRLYTVLPQFTSAKSTVGLRNWLPKHQDPIPDFSRRDNLDLPEENYHRESSNEEYENDHTNDYILVAKLRAWEGTEFLARLIIGPGKLVLDWLKGLRYIGPLRSRPPRVGIAPDELDDWSEGLAAWKALDNTTPEIFRETSDWLWRRDRLNTGYSLRSAQLVELEANDLRREILGGISAERFEELLEKATKHTRISLVTEANPDLRLSPWDVGVGIAQVLPVVVGAIVPNPKQEPAVTLVAIEQPELHIHPAMQVALGDLFIEGAAKRGTSFLIETHSEHLMLRLLRRIRETTEGELTGGSVALSPDDVSVVYVQSSDKGVEMLALPIDETGEFSTRWPKGFFDERAEELF